MKKLFAGVLSVAVALSLSPAMGTVLATPWFEPYTGLALGQLDAAAKSLGVRILRLDVRTPEDIEPAVPTVKRDGVGALLVLVSPLVFAHAARIGELAARHRIPTMAHQELVTGGYLLYYGSREQAQEHLVIATTMYREMDMQFWLKRAEAEMKPSA